LLTGQKNDFFNRISVKEYNYDYNNKLIKINLFSFWDFKDIYYFLEKFNIINNIIYNKGFLSIGCFSCTKETISNNIRSGRWWWEIFNKKKECGLHNN